MKQTFLPKQVEESCDCHVHAISVFKESTKFVFQNKNPVLLCLDTNIESMFQWLFFNESPLLPKVSLPCVFEGEKQFFLN